MNKIINSDFSKNYNNTVDLLKGIAIIFIIITHFRWSDNERLKYLFPLYIDMAVPVFMIISGYLNALSFKNRGIRSLQEAYSLKQLLSKATRFTIAFIPIYIFEIIVLALVKHYQFGVDNLIYLFLSGGVGQGSYYYPIMLQFIFIFR